MIQRMMCETRQIYCDVDSRAGASSFREECSCSKCICPLRNSSSHRRVVSDGDIVTIDLQLVPENGLVPEPLFDQTGTITFVVGWGNYLPALHELVKGKRIGDRVQNISIDAGWGNRNPDLVMELPQSKLKRFEMEDGTLPPVGSILDLPGGVQLTIVQMNKGKETVVVDANPPLAGASYACTFTVLNVENLPAEAVTNNDSAEDSSRRNSSRYEVSTWALGCFWGAELAFMRTYGVVGTHVGYTQGIVSNPTYEAVCTGKTHHREAIMVVYDPDIVSYNDLIRVAMDRLAATKVPTNNSPTQMYLDMFSEDFDEKTNKQYCHGFYHHSKEQREAAERELSKSNPYEIELKKAAIFYDAEEYHQQYLLKGGQSARKGAKETIRCYG